MDGKAIYHSFTNSEVRALLIALEEVAALTKDFGKEAESLKAARDEMMNYWEGDTADAAGKGLDPLVDAHRDSAPLLDKTVESLTAQITMFSDAKHRVVPVPDVPPAPAPYPSAWEVITNPMSIPKSVAEHKSYASGVEAHEVANENNIRVMERYASGTNSTSSELPRDYGVLEDDGSDMSISDGKIRKGHSITNNPPEAGGTSASSAAGTSSFGGGGGGSYGGAPSVYSPGGGGAGPLQPGGQAGVGGPGAGGGPGGGGGGLPPAGTRPVGGAPIVGGPIGGPVGGGGDNTRKGPFSGGVRPGTPGGRPAGGSSAGSRLAGGGAGAPKGGAAAGTVGGPKAGGGGGLGAGKGAGVGSPGGGAAAAANAAKAGGGVGGRGGMAGMAGGGAGKGKEEDQEHKRADYLQENDPESLFGTDEKTAPPVIGDPTFDPSKDPRAGK